METRTYNGYTYQRSAPGEPWTMVGPATSASPAAGSRIIADPYAARDEARKDRADSRSEEDQGIQRDRLGLSQRDTARAEGDTRIERPQALRKEYGAFPEVKEFRVANQMAGAALNTAPNPQGDISLVYAYAKAMDPGSVVRDQEANAVTASQPWFQTMVEKAKVAFGMDGAGRFTAQSRARLRQEILRAVSSRKPLYEARRAEMADYAKTYGIDPYEVVGKNDIELYAPAYRRFAEAAGDDDGVVAGLIGGEPIRSAMSPPPQAAGLGATTGSTPIPQEMQEAHAEYLRQNWGKVDPRDYAAFRVNLDRQYGFGSNPEGYAASVPAINAAAANGSSIGSIPAVETKLSGFDQFRNNALSDEYGVGAGVASGINAAGFGLPSAFAPEQMDALRAENPVSTFLGEIGGAVAGTGLAGGLLRNVGSRVGSGSVASALANPLTADLAYGTAYGATQADDPLYGAVGGAAAALVGNRVGRAIGGAFPSAVGRGSAVRDLDRTVPSSQQLRQEASRLYDAAENTGERIGSDETFALNDRLSGLLSREGRLSPTGRLTEVQPRVREAYQLAGDYAGQPMAPRQVQTIRRVMGDAVTSPDNDERRIGRLLLGEFDDWTDAAAPDMAAGLADARGVASRYLQGDEIALAREMADVRAGQFSNSGLGNALRTDFRALDRKIAQGRESFSPPVEQAVADVARGTPVGNVLRNVGRFAPTGPVSAIPTLLAASAGGASAGGTGIVAGLLAGGGALAARQLGQRITQRSAQVAENAAYAGDAYTVPLAQLLAESAIRGGHGGAALFTAGTRGGAALAGY